MSASVGNPIHNPQREILLLRWSEAPDSPPRQAPVHLVDTHVTDAIIRCELCIAEKTKVYLIGKNYTASGIINNCQNEGSYFLMTIGFIEGGSPKKLPSTFDPGVLDVEQWLTEEAEEQILKDLDSDSSTRSGLSKGALRQLLRVRPKPDPTARSRRNSTLFWNNQVNCTGLFQFLSRLYPNENTLFSCRPALPVLHPPAAWRLSLLPLGSPAVS
jgi:hypothetical protein